MWSKATVAFVHAVLFNNPGSVTWTSVFFFFSSGSFTTLAWFNFILLWRAIIILEMWYSIHFWFNSRIKWPLHCTNHFWYFYNHCLRRTVAPTSLMTITQLIVSWVPGRAGAVCRRGHSRTSAPTLGVCERWGTKRPPKCRTTYINPSFLEIHRRGGWGEGSTMPSSYDCSCKS